MPWAINEASAKRLFALKEVLLLLGLLSVVLLIPIKWLGLSDMPKFYIVHITIIGALIIDLLVTKKYSFNILDGLMAFFVIWHFLSYFWTDFPGLIWYESFHWLSLGVIYFVVKNFDLSKINKKLWLYSFLTAMVFNYIVLSVVHFDANSIHPSGLSASQVSQYVHRAFGHNCNTISSLLVILLPLSYSALTKTPLSKIIIALFYALHSYFILICNSRATFIGWIIITSYIIYVNAPLWRRYFARSIVFILIFSAVFLGTLSQPKTFFDKLNPLNSLDASGTDDRIALWARAIELINEGPLRGHGTNTYKVKHLQNGVSDFSMSANEYIQYTHAHNELLETGAELGLIGLGVLVVIFLLPLIYSLKQTTNNQYLQKEYLLLSFIVFIIASSFYGISYTNQVNIGSLDIYFIILLGILSKYRLSLVKFTWIVPILIVLTASTLMYQHKIHENQKLLNKSTRLHIDNPAQHISIIEGLSQSPAFQYADYVPLEYYKASTYYTNKQYPEALTSMQSSLLLNPYHMNSLNLLGNIYTQLGMPELAMDHYYKLVEINTHLNSVRYQLANLAIQTEDWAMFDFAVSYYYEILLPRKENFYSEEAWDFENTLYYNFWEHQCGLIDSYLELLDTRYKYTINR
jgi:Lipid A core - O-antigen ligase and related enzymes